MIVLRTIAEVREAVKQFRKEQPDAAVGLVPTMGYLHAGHASLIRKACEDCGMVVVSVFVNPLQFGPNEDFERYPRDAQRDQELAAEAGANILFMPSVDEMYPSKPLTTVSVSNLTSGLCGASRPGHFDGVCTVVSKLLHIVQPDRAYFGMKDAQQVAVIMQMTADLNIPTEIIPCPIIREADGLALSSRNVYLSADERSQALVLNRSLQAADKIIRQHPEASIGEVRERIRETIRTAPLADIDYVEIVAFPSLQVIDDAMPVREALKASRVMAALAVRFGRTRLIDNRLWDAEGGLV